MLLVGVEAFFTLLPRCIIPEETVVPTELVKFFEYLNEPATINRVFIDGFTLDTMLQTRLMPDTR